MAADLRVNGIDIYETSLEVLRREDGWLDDQVCFFLCFPFAPNFDFVIHQQIISVYLSLLEARSSPRHYKFPKVKAFSTFFYPRLMEDSKLVARWYRKV